MNAIVIMTLKEILLKGQILDLMLNGKHNTDRWRTSGKATYAVAKTLKILKDESKPIEETLNKLLPNTRAKAEPISKKLIELSKSELKGNSSPENLQRLGEIKALEKELKNIEEFYSDENKEASTFLETTKEVSVYLCSIEEISKVPLTGSEMNNLLFMISESESN